MAVNLDKYIVSSTSFFDFLSEDETAYVEKYQKIMEFKKKQILFLEDTFSKGIYIIRKGKVKIYHTNSDGKESIVHIYKKGDYFGFIPLMADTPHPISASAIDNSIVTFIPASVFNEVLNGSLNLTQKLLINLSQEFSVWINKASVFSQYPLKERVALSLLILAKVFENNHAAKNKHITISLNRDDFAAFVGTAKETLVRMFRVFKDEKIITAKGTKITILKPKALEALIDHI